MADPELLRQLRTAIMGEPRYAVDELLEQAGGRRELADELWLSLGFPLAGDSPDIEYSELDVEALRGVAGLLSLDLLVEPQLLSMTRVMGQAMARLATAQVEMFGSAFDALVDTEADGMDDDMRAALTELMVPGVERFVSYVWRRHLLAAFTRALSTDDQLPVVGFVDLVGFTKATRHLGDDELAALVTRFERHVYESITSSGARLRKLLGDGVMFDAPDAVTAATAGLDLVMRCAEDPELGGARGGLALGHTLEKDGDVYGATVNRASRLAALARPHTVLGDATVGDALRGQPGFEVRSLGDRPVKGLGPIPVAVIRPGFA